MSQRFGRLPEKGTTLDALLLCELDGNTDEVEQQLLILNNILKAANTRHVKVARDQTSRDKLCLSRKAAFPVSPN